MIRVINSLIFLFALLFSNLNANEMFQTVEAKDATLVKSDSSKDFCNVCGMHLTKYYKTNHTAEFKNGHKEQYCSMHCLAEVHKNYADKIKLIQVVDTNSLKLIDAKKAFYDTMNLTPMAYGFGAHETKENIQEGLEIIDYNIVKERVLKIGK